MNTFHWLIALRYLKRGKARGYAIHFVTLVLFLLTALVWAGDYAVRHYLEIDWVRHLAVSVGPILQIGKYFVLLVAVIIEVFVLMVQQLTLFTTISTFGLFLGSGALVIVLSVMSGFEAELQRKIIGTHAHVMVETEDGPFVDYAPLRDKLVKVPDVRGAMPFVGSEIIVVSSSNVATSALRGIDPATVGGVLDLANMTKPSGLEFLAHPEGLRARRTPIFDDDLPKPKEPEGKAARPEDEAPVLPGVVIGQEMAKDLRVWYGDEVTLISPFGGIGPLGAMPKSKRFRVAGTFYSGLYEFDDKLAYVTIASAQKLLGLDDEVSGIDIKISDPNVTEPVMTAIGALLPKGGGDYAVRDWKQLNGSLFIALKLEKILMFIGLSVIMLVAAFSIIANGIMLVREHTREIAVLKSMGATDGDVGRIFFLLGAVIAALGVLSGIAFGVGTCLLLSAVGVDMNQDVFYFTQLPVAMHPFEISLVLLAGMGIAILATIYPARLASAIRPVEGLRL